MSPKTKFRLIRLLVHVLIFIVFILGFSAFLEARTGMVSVLLARTEKHSVKVVNPNQRLKRIIAEQESNEYFRKRSTEILCTFAEPEKSLHQGEFVGTKVTKEVEEGEGFTTTFYLKNSGNVPWFSDKAPCGAKVFRMRLGTARDQDRASIFYTKDQYFDMGWVQKNRIAMKENRIDPGQIATFEFTSRAPFQEDIYREYFQPVVEGKAWFTRKEELVYMDVRVGPDHENHEDKLNFLWKSGMASVIDSEAPLNIIVDISDQKMTVRKGDTVIREYLVSTGTFQTPTPLGKGKIHNKQELRIASAYPHYRMPNWQGLAFDRHRGKFIGVGFHALPYLANDNGVFWNEALNHIGQRVSHGCIRLLPDDAKDLYSLTALGDEFVVQD